MKLSTKCALWLALLAVLTGLFHAAGSTPAQADAGRPLTLLTEAGPVTMTLEEYLPLAVAAEMPVSFGAEALKAQAVVIRTYVLAGPRHEQADVCTLGCCVAYRDEPDLRAFWGACYEENMRAVSRAVADTDGEYLVYDGEPIQAAFHAGSLGYTEDSGNLWSPLPYLVSVESPEQDEALVSTVRLSAARLARALSLAPGTDPSVWLEQTVPDSAGRVASMTFCGRTFTGAALREKLGLRSTAFTVGWDGDCFVFTVSGYGHGVGMSQYGARTYARQGLTYRDILAHYYPGTELARLAPQSR